MLCLTVQVWDYIFLEGREPQTCKIPSQTLKAMRQEFNFWYPFDLRVHSSSAKHKDTGLMGSPLACDVALQTVEGFCLRYIQLNGTKHMLHTMKPEYVLHR